MPKRIALTFYVSALTLSLFMTGVAGQLDAAEPFYQGKTLRVIVASAPGGGSDIVARLMMRHLPRHIPGNPTIVVENMPGAGEIIGTNYVYGKAKPDGLTALFATGTPVNQLIEQLDVITFLLVKGLEEARRALQNFAGRGIADRCEQRCDNAALRREADPEPLCQRRRHRAIARDGGTAKGDTEGIVHAGFIEAKNFSTTCGRGEWTQRDGARMHRFRIGRQAETDTEIDAEANGRDKIFARNFPDFFGDG